MVDPAVLLLGKKPLKMMVDEFGVEQAGLLVVDYPLIVHPFWAVIVFEIVMPEGNKIYTPPFATSMLAVVTVI